VVTHAKKNFDGRAQCNVTGTLKNEGSITVQGNVGFRRGHLQPSTLAVTGGTGEFEGSGGTLYLQPGRRHTVFTFSLT
jgi:formylmethanofuran dehydrogenase subunit C